MAKPTAYPPLTKPNSTRVVELEPRKHRILRLKGKLFEIDLDSPPPFDAISYVWGSRKDAGSILCTTPDGHQEEVKFTGNGEDVLRRMQKRNRSRLLWIDAISINQNSVSERNQQVAIMAQIYSKAQNVLVWLPNDDKEKWKDFDPTVLRRHLSRARFIHSIPFLRDNQKVHWYIRGKGDDASLAKELDRIASSSWFKRVWTLLEYAFARNCLLYSSDKSPVSATYLSGDLRGLHMHNFWNANPFQHNRIRGEVRSLMFEIQGQDVVHSTIPSLQLFSKAERQEYVRNVSRYLLGQCLRDSRSLQATQAVDRVFALYPIFSSRHDTTDWMQKPDYSKSKQQVFHEVAATIIRLEDSVSLLVTLPAVEEPNFHSSWPSWVPDYSISRRNTRFLIGEDLQPRKMPKPFLSQDRSVLQIGGLLVDRISATLPCHPAIQVTNPDHNKHTLKNKIEAWLLVLRWYRLAFASSCLPASAIAAHFFKTLTDPMLPHETATLAVFILYVIQPLSSNSTETPFCKWYNAFRTSLSHSIRIASGLWGTRWSREERDTFFAHFGALRTGDLEDHAKVLANVLTPSETVEFVKDGVLGSAYPGTKQLRSLLLSQNDPTQYFTPLSKLSDKEFFVTESGYLGITNGYVQVDDLVVLVLNLGCPTILREDAQKGAYKYVGICRIDGLMPKKRPWQEDPNFVDTDPWGQLKSKGTECFNLT